MSKLSVLFWFLVVFLLLSCETRGVKWKEPVASANCNDIYVVTVENHKYVIYDGVSKGGIVHAESCPCKEKE